MVTSTAIAVSIMPRTKPNPGLRLKYLSNGVIPSKPEIGIINKSPAT